MLITYADSLGKNLAELGEALACWFDGAVGGVHILPFFPSSADRGFAPMEYGKVDPAFGTWADIDALGSRYYLMFDFMINHISAHSDYYQDFLRNKDASVWRDLFLRYRDFWPGGEPTQEEIGLIYKRKPRAPYTEARFADGSAEKVWCTFDPEQIDLNVGTETTKRFIGDTLLSLVSHNMSIARLDAFAYAVKKRGTNCFFVEPEVWELLANVRRLLEPTGAVLLPEIHEHYSIQLKLAENGYWVYDFALPMLVLSALYLHDSVPLQNWLRICPRKQFTTLDTHDGIGVVDVKGLLSDEDIERTKEMLYTKGANVKQVYSSAAYNNLDVYQINCTYYSALGNDDDAYLLARAIQFFAPGIPQVYYVGMLAGANDLARMEATKQGREINRHSYTLDEIGRETERPVVRSLRSLMRFRNTCPAFGEDGECVIVETPADQLEIRRAGGGCEAVLRADLASRQFRITYGFAGETPKVLGLES